MLKPRVRCSEAGVAWPCPASLSDPLDDEARPDVDPYRLAGEVGNAFHAWAPSIDGVRLDVPAVARQFGVDEKGLEKLVAFACVAWRDGIGELFEGSLVEERHELETGSIVLAGAWDRAGRYGDEARVLNWKTGAPDDVERAMMAEAALALHRFGGDRVRVVYVWVRELYADVKVYTRAELRTFLAELGRRVSINRGALHPGAHCDRCRKFAGGDCDGPTRYTTSAIATVADAVRTNGRGGPPTIVPLTRETAEIVGPELAGALEKVRWIEKRCREFRGALTREVARLGGKIPGREGRDLIVQSRRERTIDPILGKEVLEELLPDEADRADATTISFGRVRDAVRDAVPSDAKRGAKKAATDELERRLEAAGAIDVSVSEFVKEVPRR